jgi:drug/metabolite transporter (DMT)-like permease
MQQHRPLLGVSLMVLSSAFLAVKDGLAKTFLDQVSPLQMIWTQYVGSLLVVTLFAASRLGLRVLQPAPLGGQIIRGTLSAAAVGTLYWALTYIPLADATAVFMCAPLLVALLAPLVLNEQLDIMRMGAVAVGFADVVVILRPGFGDSGIGYYIALLSGLLFGGCLNRPGFVGGSNT